MKPFTVRLKPKHRSWLKEKTEEAEDGTTSKGEVIRNVLSTRIDLERLSMETVSLNLFRGEHHYLQNIATRSRIPVNYIIHLSIFFFWRFQVVFNPIFKMKKEAITNLFQKHQFFSGGKQ